MEPLLQQLERFSEVLFVSGSDHVSTWGPETVRRALQWARYLRHVYRRFGSSSPIRTAVERRLRSHWGPEGPGRGLTSFQALGRGDVLLARNLLRNRALGDGACHALLRQLFPGASAPDAGAEALQARLVRLARRRAALLLLLRETDGGREGSSAPARDPLLLTQAQLLLGRLREAEAGDPGGWLDRLWARAPRDHFLRVVAVALLQPWEEELERSGPETPQEETQLLARWLLQQSDVLAAFCRRLPAGLLTSVAGRHPALSRAYLGLLTDWAEKLHYDLQKGAWVGAGSQDVPWEELFPRFQSLWRAALPLRGEVLTALESRRERAGDFQVRGLSVWTDLWFALRSSS